MSAAAFMARLYPPAVRERWGTDIAREVSASGIRSWPNTLAGATRLWLHPSDWPETFAGQTRRVLTVMLFTIAAAAGLLVRAAEPSSTLAVDPRHPVASLWVVPFLLGVILAAPLPPLRREVLGELAAAAARTLAAPVAAGLVVIALAWTGVAGHLTGFADVAVTLYYWLALGFVALRLCTLVARVARIAGLPTTRRLSLGLLLIGTGLGLAVGEDLLAIGRTVARPAGLTEVVALGLLAAMAIIAGRDMRRPTELPRP